MTAHVLAGRLLQPVTLALRTLFWLSLAVLSGLVVYNSLPYATAGLAHPFLIEKARVARDLAWRIVFYVHVAGGCICLLAALPQFSRRLLRAAPGLHRALGWSYVLGVLVLVAPSGLVLAVTAKGGMAGRLGFLVLGFALLLTTWHGLQHVRARELRGHVRWMVRSYAMTATAVSFRVLYLALHLLGVSDPYVPAIWLSFGVNLVAAEWVVRHQPRGAPA